MTAPRLNCSRCEGVMGEYQVWSERGGKHLGFGGCSASSYRAHAGALTAFSRRWHTERSVPRAPVLGERGEARGRDEPGWALPLAPQEGWRGRWWQKGGVIWGWGQRGERTAPGVRAGGILVATVPFYGVVYYYIACSRGHVFFSGR